MSETTLRAFLLIVYVTGLDVRHDCVSVPCLAYVTGLDVGNGSGERSVGGSRDWARCWTRLFQCAVFDLSDWTIFFDLSFLLGNKMPM